MLIYSELENNGGALVVAEAGVKYIRSVRYDEEIEITTFATINCPVPPWRQDVLYRHLPSWVRLFGRLPEGRRT